MARFTVRCGTYRAGLLARVLPLINCIQQGASMHVQKKTTDVPNLRFHCTGSLPCISSRVIMCLVLVYYVPLNLDR